MTGLPVIGAQMTVLDIDRHRNWLFDHDRDLELAEFTMLDVLEKPELFIEMAHQKLDGWNGRLSIHGPFSGFSLDTRDKDVRVVVQRRLSQALDVCARLGANQMVLHSPFDRWDADNQDNRPGAHAAHTEAIVESLAPALLRAEALGVELVLENIRDTDPAHRAAVVAVADTRALRLSVDVGHAFWAETVHDAPDVAQWVHAAGADLAHVHLQDSDGQADRHWIPGDGTLPFDAVFSALAETGAAPRLIVEIKNYDRIAEGAAHFASRGLAV